MNAGKQFEKDFKASVLESQFFLRLPDGGGWSDGTNTRFTPSNLCDCILYTSGRLYLLELKSHAGKSIPAYCLSQAEKLSSIDKTGVFPSFVVNFRDLTETYVISAEIVMVELSSRKSLGIETCRRFGKKIPQALKRVHWSYDLSSL